MNQAVLHLSSLRAKRSQRNSHLAAGVGMLALGIEALSGTEEHGLLKPVLEIIAGGALLVAVLIETRKAGKGHHSKVEWADFFAAFVAVVEGIGRIHKDGFWHSRLTFAWFFVAALFVAKGLYIARLPKWSRLILTDAGFTHQRPFFRRRTALWREVRDVQITDETIILDTGNSPWLRVDFKEYEQPQQMAKWCREQIPAFWQAKSESPAA